MIRSAHCYSTEGEHITRTNHEVGVVDKTIDEASRIASAGCNNSASGMDQIARILGAHHLVEFLLSALIAAPAVMYCYAC